MVLRGVVAQGVGFGLATGRPMRRLNDAVQSLSFPHLVGCANGALVYEPATHRIVACQEMSRHAVKANVTAVRQAWPDCEIAVERLIRDASSRFEQVLYAEQNATHRWPAGDRAQLIPESMLWAKPALKIMVRDRTNRSEAMAAYAGRLLADTAEVTYANPDNCLIEITQLGINKGWAAKTMAECLNVHSGPSVAFGDMPNDLPLFR